MRTGDLLTALSVVVDALEAQGVRYFVTGSLASSAHGVPRASLDADVVADLQAEHVAPFVARLEPECYIDESRVRAAVGARRSFNVIHLATMVKVDVFAAKDRLFEREAVERARAEPLEEGPGARRFSLASAEDVVVAKLEWYRLGGETSDRQWGDVSGILRSGSAPDRAYMRRMAGSLGVADLLERALSESGV